MFSLNLTHEELQTILAALFAQPYGNVAKVVGTITAQAQAQAQQPVKVSAE